MIITYFISRTTKYLAVSHQQWIHEGKKYQCMECECQANRKDDLIKHHQSIHEGWKYLCRECDYQANRKGNITTHHQSIHKRKQYQCTECFYQPNRKESQSKLTSPIEIIIYLNLSHRGIGPKLGNIYILLMHTSPKFSQIYYYWCIQGKTRPINNVNHLKSL